MEIQFNGKTALVSGAGKGIGNGIAKRLVMCGAQVIALDVCKESLELLKGEVPSIRIIAVDLSKWSETKQALERIGNIDLLVNNAGIAMWESLADISEDHIDQLFAINFKGVVNLTQIVIENLLKRKVGGSIVNISSIAAVCGSERHGIYSATKAAVDAFMKVVAVEMGPKGRRAVPNPQSRKSLEAGILLRRFAEVSDVVDAVLFLLSDKASMITGTCLPVDGGTLAAL
ncbi:L-xylulose reductase-like isoform X4 [Photinus pyralis]|uniref:L-xylulose reductase-like isoform X4 n=1 Tax=Photinus pyralis TaxID=7054 RepID=UPI001266F2E3|nr:L-xylulose reductase-like isoform X4 [Photinus pyralis]